MKTLMMVALIALAPACGNFDKEVFGNNPAPQGLAHYGESCDYSHECEGFTEGVSLCMTNPTDDYTNPHAAKLCAHISQPLVIPYLGMCVMADLPNPCVPGTIMKASNGLCADPQTLPFKTTMLEGQRAVYDPQNCQVVDGKSSVVVGN